MCVNCEINSEAYQNHPVFEKIDCMKAYYDGLSEPHERLAAFIKEHCAMEIL